MQIYEGWTKVTGEKIDDLELYIYKQLDERRVSSINNQHDVKIIIGTDSCIKNDRGKKISYLTVIVFQKGRNGSHIISRRSEERVFGYIPTPVKLNGEINRTAELALWMKDSVLITPEVHLDVNSVENTQSFEVYKYIKGYFEALGFDCYYKPEAYAATACADYYV